MQISTIEIVIRIIPKIYWIGPWPETLGKRFMRIRASLGKPDTSEHITSDGGATHVFNPLTAGAAYIRVSIFY